jgi:hypothetical protein
MPAMDPQSKHAGQGVYLYCFTRPTAQAERTGIAWVISRGVAAVVTSVRLADWDEATVATRMNDPNWLVPWAMTHQEVIEAHMALGPVLPVRFGAVFSSQAALCQYVEARAPVIQDFLDKIANLQEWAVKGFLDSDLTQAWLEANDDRLAERQRQLPASPGKRYFEEKRLQAEIRKRAQQWENGLSQTLGTELTAAEFDCCPLRARPSENGAEKMVFHAAFLLPHPSVPDFQNRVRQLQSQYASQGLRLETTGPWPPYSFCPDLEGDGS